MIIALAILLILACLVILAMAVIIYVLKDGVPYNEILRKRNK